MGAGFCSQLPMFDLIFMFGLFRFIRYKPKGVTLLLHLKTEHGDGCDQRPTEEEIDFFLTHLQFLHNKGPKVVVILQKVQYLFNGIL